MKPIDSYCASFESLTPASLDKLLALVRDDVVFRDPFNDVAGMAAYRAIFEDMFARVESPRFDVTERFGGDPNWALRWRFRGRAAAVGDLDVEGMSFIFLDADGRIARHLDYWDAGLLYERVPVLGSLLRWLRRRVSAS